jgi:hypothetical protein
MNPISNSKPAWQRWLAAFCIALMLLSVSACNAQAPNAPPAEKPAAKAPIGTRMQLGLVGYNYTNRYIDTFDVDGQGGGNLFVSGPGGGGGGTACCVNYRSGVSTWEVTVRWQIGACIFNERTDGEGGKHHDTHSFFKEVKVQVDPNIPDQPRYFEVHFYPDGHVEAAITEHASPPRLVLAEDREDRSHYPRCPNGKEPKE